MMLKIELTSAYTGMKVFVNAEHLAMFGDVTLEETKERRPNAKSWLAVLGDKDTFLVEETPKEIGRKIDDAQKKRDAESADAVSEALWRRSIGMR